MKNIRKEEILSILRGHDVDIVIHGGQYAIVTPAGPDTEMYYVGDSLPLDIVGNVLDGLIVSLVGPFDSEQDIADAAEFCGYTYFK